MSPAFTTIAIVRLCFPRVSGDEPGPEDLDKVLLVFSPRERG